MSEKQVAASLGATTRISALAAFTGSVAAEGLSIQEARKTLEEFRTACRDPQRPAEELDRIAQRLQDAGFKHEMSDILVEALGTAEANPQVGALWIRRLVASKSWRRSYPEYLDQLAERGEIGQRAILELLRHLNVKGRRRLIRVFLRKQGERVRELPEGCELAAAALARAGCFRQALRWTARRQTTSDAPLSMLYVRAAALRGLGREKQALPFIDQAIERGGLKQYPLLGLWKTMEEALAGNTETAARLYRELKPAGWDEDSFAMYDLARGVVRVRQAPRDERKMMFYSAYNRVRNRFRKHRVHKRHWSLRRAYRRCVWRMSMDAGIWWRAWAAPWKSADSVFMIPVLLLVPGLQLLLPVYLFRLLRHRHEPSR